MQVINLHDTKTSTYSNESGSFIEGFLIGTKKNKNGWQISKRNIGEYVGKFQGKPFIIIPEKVAHGIDAHYHGATKEETEEGYKKYAHGTIVGVIGPIPYNDGTDDFYYTHVTKLNNSKSASVLQQYGSGTPIPFSTSPHVWHEDPDPSSNYVEKFTPIGIALVYDAAYGEIAVINKMCNGPAKACTRSLGAANQHCGCCENTDENIANIISSRFSKSASVDNSKLSTNPNSNSNNNSNTTTNNDATTTTLTPPNFPNPTVNPQNTLTNEPQKDDNKIIVTKEEYDRINKELQESQTFKKELEKLRNERNEEKVTSVFKDYVNDQEVLKEIIKKHRDNADYVTELYTEFNKYVVPSIVEKTKAEYQKEIDAKNNTAEQNKKSKGAALLRPEPKPQSTTSEQDKAASNQNVNQVKLLRKYLFGEK